MMVAMVMNCYCVVMMLITVDSNGLPQKEEFNFMILFSRFISSHYGHGICEGKFHDENFMVSKVIANF